jgi:hypothetical protein
LSINMKPRLWRVRSYSAPGFPNPTIKYIVYLLSTLKEPRRCVALGAISCVFGPA